MRVLGAVVHVLNAWLVVSPPINSPSPPPRAANGNPLLSSLWRKNNHR